MNRPPEVYFPCLAHEEQSACKLAYASVVPPYVFVIPCAPLDAYFASLTTNWTDRQKWWEDMFHFRRITIEPVPGFEAEVYTDLYGFLSDWLLYPPINGGTDDTRCRMYEYSQV